MINYDWNTIKYKKEEGKNCVWKTTYNIKYVLKTKTKMIWDMRTTRKFRQFIKLRYSRICYATSGICKVYFALILGRHGISTLKHKNSFTFHCLSKQQDALRQSGINVNFIIFFNEIIASFVVLRKTKASKNLLWVQEPQVCISCSAYLNNTNMNNSTVPFDHDDDRMQVPYAIRAVFFSAISTVGLISVIGNVLRSSRF